MTAHPKQRGSRVGRPPAGDETASEIVKLRVTPTQLADWRAMAEARGISLSATIVEAMDLLDAREDDDEGPLADLGRDMLALAESYRRVDR